MMFKSVKIILFHNKTQYSDNLYKVEYAISEIG